MIPVRHIHILKLVNKLETVQDGGGGRKVEGRAEEETA